MTTSLLTLAYPWTKAPFIVSAPMRLISLSSLATAVTKAGGFGFIGSGYDLNALSRELDRASTLLNHPLGSKDPLPIGIGYINWGVQITAALEAIGKYVPAAVWLFAPLKTSDLKEWSEKVRERTKGKTKIWVQIASVEEALQTAKTCKPDVLVVQGIDSGGHGLERGAGITTLLPEVADNLEQEGFSNIPLLAAGGITEGRGVAAALTLGAQGVVMGTRFLASPEAEISKGYRDVVLAAKDGGQSTIRTKLYDELRGTNQWPSIYNARGIINKSFEDDLNGMSLEENKRLYAQALEKGDLGFGIENGRLTAYAGTGVGLIREIKSASEIVEEVRRDAQHALQKARNSL